jgi:8-oxo-dGTP pyrophosphatase MutT (NUDIX family)
MSRLAAARREELRGMLLDPAEAAAIEMHATVQAAVLVPLHVKRGVLHAVFTQRHHELPRHAGEISFPGGRREPGDTDLVATALRETHEEVGLPSDSVELIGALEPTPTVVTGYAIYPFVGIVPSGFRWRPSASEVAAVIDLPLPAVAAGYGRRRLVRRGVAPQIMWPSTTYVSVWIATARIVSDLLDRIGGLIGSTADDHAAESSAA